MHRNKLPNTQHYFRFYDPIGIIFYYSPEYTRNERFSIMFTRAIVAYALTYYIMSIEPKEEWVSVLIPGFIASTIGLFHYLIFDS